MRINERKRLSAGDPDAGEPQLARPFEDGLPIEQPAGDTRGGLGQATAAAQAAVVVGVEPRALAHLPPRDRVIDGAHLARLAPGLLRNPDD